ncbi:hypothetical protein [Metabacillus halosaccharovorans]|uniref:Uncharacterized protein n=1 Tax=Metabacillus halosaccharovorans TaxID=930124 RepID=A0ABT3DIF8_9BACI|nr:hypothetical protein [Metabacillus halosaccharovorans]MCV9886437.1 hypothetical protein [Metabacillus halosaccharovorans]
MKKTLVICLFLLSLTYKHTYGITGDKASVHPISFEPELPNWEEVKKVIPRQSTFTVLDVDTGKKFDVQRRAGSGHADVQPLTKEDTVIMKAIYNGNWSWRRRAVLIQVKDRLIPASMHGMPHGAGALQNGFPGHFCIHFSESKTHRTGKLDLSHHIMILKAAGKFDEYITTLTPEQSLEVFLLTVKNNDKELSKKMVLSNHRNLNQSFVFLNDIEGMQWTIKETSQDAPLSLSQKVSADMKIYLKTIGPVKVKQTFTLVRISPFSSWKVIVDPFLEKIPKS